MIALAPLIPILLQILITLGIALLCWEIAKQMPQPNGHPPSPRPHRPRGKELELVRLLYGDEEQAQRLIRQAGGSVDKAIARLVADRSR